MLRAGRLRSAGAARARARTRARAAGFVARAPEPPSAPALRETPVGGRSRFMDYRAQEWLSETCDVGRTAVLGLVVFYSLG